MRKLRCRLYSRLWLALPMTCVCLFHQIASAQDTSFSPSLSSPLIQSTSTSGFNSVFDSESANLTNPELHTDISDPTHSQLLGSVLSPASIPVVNSDAGGTPQTGTLSDAQLASQYGAGGVPGHRDSAFGSSAISSRFSNLVDAQSFRGGGYGAMGGQMASAEGLHTRNAFSASASSVAGNAPATPISGSLSPDLDPRFVSRQRVDSLGTSLTVGVATDPVLTGTLMSLEDDLHLQGDMPAPSSQTAQFFASFASPSITQYQYEDGQTPPLRTFETPGVVLGAAPSYGVASNGFPDSTRGSAGLAAESEALGSPLERIYTGMSPLASSMADNASGLRQRLNPNLHASPAPTAPQSFETFERQAQDRRLLSGLSISQSSMVYQKDLRDYQRRGQRRSSRLQSSSGALLNDGRQQEMVPRIGR